MPRDYPDFGMSEDKVVYPIAIDLGELAARLGALSRYDRSGDVIAYEDFGGDLGAWEVEDSGAGETVEVTAERKVTGSFSCKLSCVVAADSYAGLRMRLPVPYSVMYGVEFQYTLHEDLKYHYILIEVYTGAYHLGFGIRWDKATGQNSYYNAGGGWTAIPGVSLPYFEDHNFIVSKFTFNISTMRYSRLLIPPRLIDLSAYTGYAWPDDVNRPRMECSGRLYGETGETPYTYIDSMILTANDI